MKTQAPSRRPQAFTLVELLVVVSIIVVLLAMLLPAMNRAMYQAQLTVCATNLKAVATGGTTYALDNKRMYPKVGKRVGQPANLLGEAADYRPALRRAINLNDLLNCPLNGFVDYETQVTGNQGIWADYNLYFGWAFDGQRGMDRLDETWTCDRKPYRILAADRDLVMPGRPELQSSHPDRKLSSNLVICQDSLAPWGQQIATISLWQRSGFYQRGEIDQNFAYDDGAVVCIRDVTYDDPRMNKVRTWSDNHEFPGAYSQLPD